MLVPLGFFLILAVVRHFDQPRPFDPQRFRAYPLPSAGIIPMLQEMCRPPSHQLDDNGFHTRTNPRLFELVNRLDEYGKQQRYFELNVTPKELEQIPATFSTIAAGANMVNGLFNKLPNATVSNLFHDPELMIEHLEHEFSLPSKRLHKMFNYPLNLTQMPPYLFEKLGEIFIRGGQMSLDKIKSVSRIVNLLAKLPYAASGTIFDRIKTILLQSINFQNLLCTANSKPINHTDWKIVSKLNPKTLKKDMDRMIRNVRTLFSVRSYLRQILDLKSEFLDTEISANQTDAGRLNVTSIIQKYVCGDDSQHNQGLGPNDYDKKDPMHNNKLTVNSTLSSLFTGQWKILYSPSNSDVDKIIAKVNDTLGFPMVDVITEYALSCQKMMAKLKEFLNRGHSRERERQISVVGSDVADKMFSIFEVINKHRLLQDLDTVSNMASAWLQFASNLKLNMFVGFYDESALLNYFHNEVHAENVTVLAALSFVMNGDGSLPQHVTYSIRQNASFFPDTKKTKYRHWYNVHITRGSGYYWSGFVMLQDLIDRAIISLHGEKDVVEPGNYVQEIPIPCYIEDKLIEGLEHMLPMNSVISWVYVVALLVQNIVHEKEHRLKEVMKSMGLSELVHFLSWFLLSFSFCTVSAVVLTAILKLGGIMPYSDATMLFVIFELYGISTIAIASMFSKAKVASACAGIGYFLLFVPSIYIGIQEEFNAQHLTTLYISTFLISPTVFSRIASFIAYYEEMGIGVRWDNWHKSPIEDDQFGMRPMLSMLALDSVLYFILTWYINNVFPGEYGLPRPWNFLFTKSYWCEIFSLTELHNKKHPTCSGIRLDISFEDGVKEENVPFDNKKYFESEPKHLVRGVCIDRLVKIYGQDNKVAVKDLSLNFYEGQITAFLGHNGAGKTTTLSILTGILPPTSGTATIYGLDIRTDMTEIRRKLGMCPQHNVLFDQLTVEEHIWFYAHLKGVPPKDISDEMERMIEDMGLRDKRTQIVDCLAGGMKRKLSVGIAFVGNSRTVILDEPTSGIDPCARRAIWDLILKYKKGRTIIISTHHMDEAETLGDRIAIIANGKLQCCGSPVHLKNNLGTGYHLYLTRDVARNAEEIPATENHVSQSPSPRQWELAVTVFIREYIHSVHFVSESPYELHYILPLSELKNGNYEKMFTALDANLPSLRVGSYGVKSATLEEVFLHVSSRHEMNTSMKSKLDIGHFQKHSEDEQPTKMKKDVPVYPANYRCGDVSRSHTKSTEAMKSVTGRLRKRKSLYQRLPTDDSIEIVCPFGNTKEREFGSSTFAVASRCVVALQLCAIVRKRYCCTKRNWKALFSQIILPAIFVSVAMTVALTVPSFDDPPPLLLSTKQFHAATQPRGQFVAFSNTHTDEKELRGTKDASSSHLESTLMLPSGLGSACILKSKDIVQNSTLFPHMFEFSCREALSSNVSLLTFDGHHMYMTNNKPPMTSHDQRYYPICHCSTKMSGFKCSGDFDEPPAVHLLTGETLFNISGHNDIDYLLYTYDMYKEHRYGALSFGLMRDGVLPSFANGAPYYFKKIYVQHAAKAWYESTGFHTMPTFVNALNNAILRANLPLHKGNPAAYGITAVNHPLPNTNSLAQYENLLMGTDLVIAIFVITAMAFVPASFVLNLVHERITKAKHLHTVSGVVPSVYWAGNYLWDLINYLVPAVFCLIIFKLFGVAAYTEGSNFPAVILLFLFYGWAMTPAMYPFSFRFQEPSVAYIVLVVANLFLGLTCLTTVFLLRMDKKNKSLELASKILDNVFLIFPNYCLGKGLMDLAINDYRNFYYTKIGRLDKIISPFSWNNVPKKLLAMAACGLVFFFVTLFFEKHSTRKSQKKSTLDRNKYEATDEDVAAEIQRVRKGGAADDVILLNNLTKVYHDKKLGELLAVDNICMGIPVGECFGLLGVNGAGKTTAFKMLTGDTSITNGDAFINGYSICRDFKKVRKFIGYCPQFDALHDDLTAREHLEIYCCFHGISNKRQKKVVDWALIKLDLVAYADKLVRTYSGGTKRKLSTALALLGNPAVLFLDEPTTGMDPRSRRFLWDIILGLVRQGQSIVLTSHSMEECEALCNRLTIMVNGRFRCLGSVQHLKNRFGGGYSITVRIKEAHTTSVEQFFTATFPKAVLKGKHFNVLHYELQKSDMSLAYIFSCLESATIQYPIEDYSLCQNTLDNVFINFVKQQTMESSEASKQTELDDKSDTEISTNVPPLRFV